MNELDEILTIGLKLHGLDLDDTVTMILLLKTPANKIQMIEYMLENEKATAQEVMNEATLIHRQTSTK